MRLHCVQEAHRRRFHTCGPRFLRARIPHEEGEGSFNGKVGAGRGAASARECGPQAEKGGQEERWALMRLRPRK